MTSKKSTGKLFKTHDTSLEYMSWFTKFVEELTPDNNVEKVLLANIVEKTRVKVVELLNYDLTNTTFNVWKKIISDPFFTKRERNMLIYYRYPRLRALRTLLPHF